MNPYTQLALYGAVNGANNTPGDVRNSLQDNLVNLGQHGGAVNQRGQVRFIC